MEALCHVAEVSKGKINNIDKLTIAYNDQLTILLLSPESQNARVPSDDR
jgi:hypothetical protein